MSISQEIQRIKTNIANAYTQANAKGATLPQQQNSANLASTISSIQTGGGTPVNVEEKDINFYDYDGTRLYSYTLAEVQNLTELPALPSHSGLTCQGWNWTLADIKAERRKVDVGTTYITDDGKTRLYIKIETKNTMNVSVCFRQSVANGVELDWGDGSAVETFNDSGSTTILQTHTYTNIGEYVITLNPINNCELSFGGGDSFNGIMGNCININTRVYQNMLYKIETGNNVTNIDNSAFYNCYSLSNIIMPNNVTNIGNQAFKACYNLSNIIIPKTVTNIDNSAFYNCYSLSNIIMPNNVTNIGNQVFYVCSRFSHIIIPKTVTNIGNEAFTNCYGMGFYDFSSHTSIPTLSNTNAFNNISLDCKIIVPDNLYASWRNRTNWSTYASKIIKKSAWDAL